MKYVDVILPLSVESVYTYTLPINLENENLTGRLVFVPFVGSKIYTALILRQYNEFNIQDTNFELKEIISIADNKLYFSPEHLQFLSWLSTYYLAHLGDVLRAVLPIVFRLESIVYVTRRDIDITDFIHLSTKEQTLLNFLNIGEYIEIKNIEKSLKLKNTIVTIKKLLSCGYIEIKENIDELFKPKYSSIVSLSKEYTETELNQILDNLKRSHSLKKIIEHWIEAGYTEIERTELCKVENISSASIKKLCEKGIFKINKIAKSRLEYNTNEPTHTAKILGQQQQKAFSEVLEKFKEKDSILIHGVTSSGKTEVYIHLIQHYLEIVKRLQRVFGKEVGVYHSGMSDNMRAELWYKQCSNNPYKIILGVRSSVFLPFTNLGLIIVDEEHDSSYKQKDPAPRYNGRDSAIMRAKLCGAKVLLGSATPSFESYYNAMNGKYALVEMLERYGGIEMPQIVIADTKEAKRKKIMNGNFTPLLIDEISKVLEKNKQVILFQNKRGYSSYLQCSSCSTIPRCKRCDVSMTYYKQRNLLICRYCGAIEKVTHLCNNCHSNYIERTPGTEKIEEEVRILFPQAKVARVDIDTMRDKTKFRHLIEDFENSKIDILVGTQMISKGLDFDNVNLVGVIDADGMLSFPDFRAEERAFSMLLQVSGRSGRREERGRVLIQTDDTTNRIYQSIKKSDYINIYKELLQERQIFMYPPFSRVIQIELRHIDSSIVRNAANYLAEILRNDLNSRVCGPAVPDISRIKNQYRIVINLKLDPSNNLSLIKSYLKQQIAEVHKNTKLKSVRIFCDVDS